MLFTAISDSKPTGAEVRLPLRVNFTWTFVGNAVYAACQWGMLSVLAKLGSPGTVGQFALGLAITAPVMMFLNLQLRGIQATDASGQFVFGHYLGLRMATILVSLVVIFGLIRFGDYEWQMGLVILAIGGAKAVESVNDIFYGLFQQRERMDLVACSMLIRGPLSLITLASGYYLTRSLLVSVLGVAFCWTIVLLCYDIPRASHLVRSCGLERGIDSRCQPLMTTISPSWESESLLRLTWLALPLGMVMLLNSLNTNIPRYFIQKELGDAQLGIFAAMAYFLVAGNTVVAALGQSASPRLAKYFAARNINAYCRLLLRLAAIGVSLGMLGILLAVAAGGPLLTVLYSAEFSKQVDVLVWLMIGATFTYIAAFLGYGMTAARRFGVQLPLFALVAASVTVLSYLLVPAWGLVGAAWAVVVAGIVQVVGSAGVIGHALTRIGKELS